MRGVNMGDHKIYQLIENSGYLPKIPKDVGEVLEMLNSPVELDIDMLIEKVSNTEQLNELMIRNLNSGYFQLSKRIDTIREAIIYLGMHTVQNLLIFFITSQLFNNLREKRPRIFTMKRYWNHVLGTSVASCMISSRIKVSDRYKLFSYGLIHDIGIAVLDTCLPELIDKITEKLQNGTHQIIAERIVLGGITHSDIGAWLCRKWNLRDDIVNIVEIHHTPFLAKSNNDELKIIHLADVISTDYYEKLFGLNLNHGMNTKIMNSLGIAENDIQVISEVLPKELEKLSGYFSL